MSWRDRLRPAFFRAVPFHVDENEIAGGRRLAPHEYPKRNSGYTEDMGRRMRAYRVRGYLIGANYDLVVCANFSSVETKDEGGYATFDMDFLEAGSPVTAAVATDTAAAVTSAAEGAKASVADSPMAGVIAP